MNRLPFVAWSAVIVQVIAGCGMRPVVGGEVPGDGGRSAEDSGTDAGPVVDAAAQGDAGACARECPPGQVCNPALGGCAQCATDADCTGGTCLTERGECVECADASDCDRGEFCDASNRCLAGCTSDADCGGATPACDTLVHRCVPCLDDTHCPGTTPHCLADMRRCVQCERPGTRDSSCPSETPFCDDDNLCVQCLSSTDCGPATACSAAGFCSPLCSSGASCGDPRFECCIDAGDTEGLCLDTNRGDVANCGGCDVACDDLPFSSPVCTVAPGGASCGIACDVDRGDCDGDVATDCEVDLRADPAHCGACGSVCDLNHVDVHGCTARSCTVATCDSGFGDCNDVDVDGCEQRLDARLSCGACGNVCENWCDGASGCQAAVDVSLGRRHVLAVMEDASGRRSVHCLGSPAERSSGMCGDGVGFTACGIVRVALPDAIHWDHVGAGSNFGCALGDGRVFCWGENSFGQLGDGSTTRRMAPVDTGLTDVTHLTVGIDHACARRADGSVWCWGSNASGKAGLGTLSGTANRPMQVFDGGMTIVRTGAQHTCAVRTDGAVFCWGLGAHGRLGNASTDSTGTPAQVMGVTGVRFADVQPQMSHTCATTADGEMYCWGNNNLGQLCTGDRMIQPIPRRVVSGVDRMVGAFDQESDDAVTVWRDRTGALNACGAARRLSRSVIDAAGTTTPVAVSYHDCDPGGSAAVLGEHTLYGPILPYVTALGFVNFEGFGPPLGWSCAPGVCSGQYPFRI